MKKGYNKKNIGFWVLGFFAFIWLLIRSGRNPKRLAYPCQQAAFPLAFAFVASVGGVTLWTTILTQLRRYTMPIVLTLLMVTLINEIVLRVNYRPSRVFELGTYPVWLSQSENSKVFVFDNIAPYTRTLAAGNSSVPDTSLADPAIDSLVAIMAGNGQPFYKTTGTPAGIVGSSDVVIIKGNFQWRNRLSTNTDRIKGVIWRILNHPDGFTGEILVCDNGSGQVQNQSYFCGISHYANNSDDTDQSIIDVIATFKAKGYKVDTLQFDRLNTSIVAEYSAGNATDGYVYNSTTKVNYPKFETPEGNYISLRYGIWDSQAETYDNDRLTIINMPVLKAHHMAGATIALKNWMGVMNNIYLVDWYGGEYQFHYNYALAEYALPARVMDVCWPKLNIVDATYTSPLNNYDYSQQSVRTNAVLASTDPAAVSWYAAKYILTPVATYPAQTNPDGSSYYNGNINYWTDFLQAQGRSITIDSANIAIYKNINTAQTRRIRMPAKGAVYIGGRARVIEF